MLVICASLVVGGVAGIGLTLIIGFFYDAGTLGVFNQVFACYVVFSQFATGGCHNSVLKHVGELALPSRRVGHIVLPALVAVTCFSAGATTVFWLSRHAVGSLLESPRVATAMAWATPGLFFFGLNKVLMGSLNGLGRLRWYALFQGARAVLMLLAVLAVALRRAEGPMVAVALSVAEVIVLAGLLAILLPNLRPGAASSFLGWIARHVRFGLRSLPGGLTAELSTRVDILVLGCFASDGVTGVYSLAAILAEGVMQFPVAIRTTFAPGLAKLLAADDRRPLAAFLRNGKRLALTLMVPTAVLALPAYAVLASLLDGNGGFGQSWILFAILVTGIVAASPYIPFGQLLLLGGRPGAQSTLVILLVLASLLVNLAMVPILGATGAAIANATTQVVFVLLLKRLSSRILGLSI